MPIGPILFRHVPYKLCPCLGFISVGHKMVSVRWVVGITIVLQLGRLRNLKVRDASPRKPGNHSRGQLPELLGFALDQEIRGLGGCAQELQRSPY